MPFKIWVNTYTPQATLDIAWSVRVQPLDHAESYVCFHRACDADTEWSIIYINSKFYWCIKDNTAEQFHRHAFELSTTDYIVTETAQSRQLNCWRASNIEPIK